MVCGTPHLDFGALTAATRYEGYTPDSAVVQWLWSIVEGMSIEEKKRFLKFFSGEGSSSGWAWLLLRGCRHAQLRPLIKDSLPSRIILSFFERAIDALRVQGQTGRPWAAWASSV